MRLSKFFSFLAFLSPFLAPNNTTIIDYAAFGIFRMTGLRLRRCTGRLFTLDHAMRIANDPMRGQPSTLGHQGHPDYEKSFSEILLLKLVQKGLNLFGGHVYALIYTPSSLGIFLGSPRTKCSQAAARCDATATAGQLSIHGYIRLKLWIILWDLKSS